VPSGEYIIFSVIIKVNVIFKVQKHKFVNIKPAVPVKV
jgi:hypothetical protein